MAYRGAPGVKTVFLHCPRCGKKGVNLRLREDDYYGCRYCQWYCRVTGDDTFDVRARETLRAANLAYFMAEEAPERVEGDDVDATRVAICASCRGVIRRYGPTEDDLWFHASTGSVYCNVPKPIAAPAPGINDDEIAALNAYVAAHPGC